MSCWTLDMIGRWQKQGYLRTLREHSCCRMQVSTANNYKFDLACNPRPAVLLEGGRKDIRFWHLAPLTRGETLWLAVKPFFSFFFFILPLSEAPTNPCRPIYPQRSTGLYFSVVPGDESISNSGIKLLQNFKMRTSECVLLWFWVNIEKVTNGARSRDKNPRCYFLHGDFNTSKR